MTRLLVPELERYLTRRPTWIGGVIALGLAAALSVLVTVDRSHDSYPVSLSQFGPALIIINTVVIGAWAYFTAASAIGSEQTSGALGTWLTFNPRRHRVFVAKLITVSVPAALLSALGLLVALGWNLIVSDRHDAALLGELVGMAVRGVLVTTSFAILGFVIALIGRSTLSALGFLIGWLVLAVLQLLSVSSLGGEWIGLERVIAEFLHNNEGYRAGSMLGIGYEHVVLCGLIWFTVVGAAAAVGAAVFSERDVQ